MARKVFEHHEAVSAVVPNEGSYRAAIAIKALQGGGAPQFHKVLDGQSFGTAHEADSAAAEVLSTLVNVDDDGEPVFDLT
ncbi:hypothetical protein [Pseudomonas sp. CFBP 13719]|jgi:hypothetical protein|uniref:hypothetical protein n=1 Tax=Pseudomonas sp. CFBP 13719 TaxID=2775303 RepID=UPI00177FFB10|nr:hypothetical protein [Pseudomonas sp. CFBP 13719]MBD8680861.1 hypothetical protein [Pseudomonas sp. CFBP 13719]